MRRPSGCFEQAKETMALTAFSGGVPWKQSSLTDWLYCCTMMRLRTVSGSSAVGYKSSSHRAVSTRWPLGISVNGT